MFIRILAALVLCAFIHSKFGPDGLIVLGIGVLAFILLRTRPFTSCGHCRGHGARTRILGAPVSCRRCGGTGFGTRADRRKAPLMPPKNTGGGR